jgi:HK97 family phage prohead protease
MTDLERRSHAADPLVLEERAEGDKKMPVLRGYAAVFNSLSQDLGGFREQIAPGAFAEALTGDVRLLINHQGLPLARTTSRTLALREDDYGLMVEAKLDPTDPDVAGLIPKLQRGDLSQMSFGFSVKPGGQDWAKNDDGMTVRTLKAVRLFEVSVVTFPAYPTTEVAMRSLDAWRSAQQAPRQPNLLAALAAQARALA